MKQKTMTTIMTVIKAVCTALGIGAAFGGAAYLATLADYKLFEKNAEKIGVVHFGNDISRSCLSQCKDKAVERFYAKEGKLVCECSEIKNPQKR